MPVVPDRFETPGTSLWRINFQKKHGLVRRHTQGKKGGEIEEKVHD